MRFGGIVALDAVSFEMSAGQSGHFLSPNFADQQSEWLAGAPAPFLAGPPKSRIVLMP